MTINSIWRGDTANPFYPGEEKEIFTEYLKIKKEMSPYGKFFVLHLTFYSDFLTDNPYYQLTLFEINELCSEDRTISDAKQVDIERLYDTLKILNKNIKK